MVDFRADTLVHKGLFTILSTQNTLEVCIWSGRKPLWAFSFFTRKSAPV
ncbi:hypothetical protein JSQ81_15500 [Sporosarcina sp. Marseille-Q4063]|nr:hypothetical protein [Sporosarcina sp. Marseille-Q4063]QUW21200.1 hypothetical protein JSQ81_15500 [Sporosarcina sp. Marseille-Q4063]